MSSTNQDSEAIAVPVAYEKTAALFRDYPSDKYNRLLPTLTVADCAGELVKARIELVKIDPKLPELDKYKKPIAGTGSGEVYQDKRMPEGTVALTRRALQKFNHAGGLIFPPQINKATWDSTNCFYQAAGAIKKADGSLLVVTASKLVDLELEEIKFRAQVEKRNEYREKDGKTPWTQTEMDAQVKRDLIQARENMIQNAETKAQNRVTRKVYALKDAYTIEELRKPFVMIRFDQVFNLDDPRQANLILQAANTASGNLFPLLPLNEPPAGKEVLHTGTGEVVEVTQDPTVEPDADDLDLEPPSDQGDMRLVELMKLDYDTLKKRFKKAIDAINWKDKGERETHLRVWRLVHKAPQDERLGHWAKLVQETEARREEGTR